LLSQFNRPSEKQQQLGVWVLLDRSASMSTVQDGEVRMDAARTAIRRVAGRAASRQSAGTPCFRLSTFDLAREDAPGERYDALELFQAAALAKPRPLGTDLGLVQQAVQSAAGPDAAGCRISHFVVVTDTPAPPWVAAVPDHNVDWIDISRQTGNAGLTEISSVRDLFSGKVERVEIEAAVFGGMRQSARLTVRGPDGGIKLEQDIGSSAEQPWKTQFKPDVPGTYRIDVTPGGAYRFDDHAEIERPAIGGPEAFLEPEPGPDRKARPDHAHEP